MRKSKKKMSADEKAEKSVRIIKSFIRCAGIIATVAFFAGFAGFVLMMIGIIVLCVNAGVLRIDYVLVSIISLGLAIAIPFLARFFNEVLTERIAGIHAMIEKDQKRFEETFEYNNKESEKGVF